MKISFTFILLLSLSSSIFAQSTSQPTSSPAFFSDEMSQIIQNISSSVNVNEASFNYARGCSINRKNIKLQDAYMKKLLKLGRPDIANIPAQELIEIDTKNGIAWGNISYIFAKRGQTFFLQSLTNGLKAIVLDTENTGICQNVSQLVMWYEVNKLSSLDANSNLILKKLSGEIPFSKEYDKNIKIVKDNYVKIEKNCQVKKKDVDSAVAEAKKIETKYKQLNETLKAKGKSYDAEIKKIDTIQNQLNNQNNTGSTDYRQIDAMNRNKQNLQRQINTAKSNADKLLSEGEEMRKQADIVKKEWETKRDDAIKLQKSVNSNDELINSFEWSPPAVDDIIHPDLTIVKNHITTSAPSAAPVEISLDMRIAEAEASDSLDMAKFGVNSKDVNMKNMAKDLLTKIIKEYSKTKAVVEAKLLLEKMNAMD